MQTDSFNLLLQSANNLTEIVTLLYKMRKKYSLWFCDLLFNDFCIGFPIAYFRVMYVEYRELGL